MYVYEGISRFLDVPCFHNWLVCSVCVRGGLSELRKTLSDVGSMGKDKAISMGYLCGSASIFKRATYLLVVCTIRASALRSYSALDVLQTKKSSRSTMQSTHGRREHYISDVEVHNKDFFEIDQARLIEVINIERVSATFCLPRWTLFGNAGRRVELVNRVYLRKNGLHKCWPLMCVE